MMYNKKLDGRRTWFACYHGTVALQSPLSLLYLPFLDHHDGRVLIPPADFQATFEPCILALTV